MTYRDDEAGWLARRRRLETELATAADPARGAIASELEAIDAIRLEAARARVPAIARARVASPCAEAWETMSGDGAVRQCSRCDKKVLDLSQMTLGRAETLIAAEGARACVRLHRRADGTMLFGDCTIGARGVIRRRLAVVGAAAALGGVALVGSVRAPAPHSWSTYVSQGEMMLVEDGRRGVVTFGRAIGGRRDGLDPAAVDRAFRTRRAALEACYERELELAPSLDGYVVVRITVVPWGEVTDVSTPETTVTSDPLAACVVTIASGLRFDPAPERASTYDVRVEFTPAPGQGVARM